MPETAPLHYPNASLCRACGGACCKHGAGIYAPTDFDQEITPAFVLALLQTGRMAIDWWDGDATGGERDRTCYIRPRHKNERAVVAGWGGVCVNWSADSGCALPPATRPYQCRMLIPHEENGVRACHYNPEDAATKGQMAARWYPYQAVLEEAIRLFYADATKNAKIA